MLNFNIRSIYDDDAFIIAYDATCELCDEPALFLTTPLDDNNMPSDDLNDQIAHCRLHCITNAIALLDPNND